MEEHFSFGIEEEYFLVDAETKAVICDMPKGFLAAAKKAAGQAGGQVTSEMLQAQIEVATAPHTEIKAARKELRDLRRTLADVAAAHGLGILAAGTHPTGSSRDAQQTESERYDAVMEDLQMIGRRNMLCGMHVHVELPDPDARVSLMTRMLPFLPLFIALATSSPFWHSRPTGLKSYRLAAYDEEPRTGMPELFHDKKEFDAYVAALVKAGVIADASFIWWAMRPSLAHGGGCNGYMPDDKGWGRGNRPVINVNWNDAKAFAEWLSRKTGMAYRLLSEAEHEYVTRAGTTTPFWWGSSISPNQANYNGDYTYVGGPKGEYRGRTVSVDNFEANPWGLFNVHGNVWEWTEDCWNDINEGNPGNGGARTTGDCSRNVVRGGSWVSNPKYLRAAFRFGITAGTRGSLFGFRLARTL
jgi:YbdK family carboxylate-amine ligase